MYKLILVCASCLLIPACQSGNHVSGLKVLIGATVVTAPGAAPIEDGVVVVSGSTIRAAGLRKDVPIPQDSERTDLSGKWLLPAGNARIEPGQAADIVVVDAAPNGAVPSVDSPVSRRMIHGLWN